MMRQVGHLVCLGRVRYFGENWLEQNAPNYSRDCLDELGIGPLFDESKKSDTQSVILHQMGLRSSGTVALSSLLRRRISMASPASVPTPSKPI